MVCGSGMKSLIEGARSILAGDAEIIVCGGTESMSGAPYLIPDARWGARMGDKKIVDSMIQGRPVGRSTTTITWARLRRISMTSGASPDRSRTSSPRLPSRRPRPLRPQASLTTEIVAVPVKVKKNMVDFNKDEFPKAGVTAEGISKLRGAFSRRCGVAQPSSRPHL